MCGVLQIARSTFYYKPKKQTRDDELTDAIVEIFHKNRKVYGTRKIKVKEAKRIKAPNWAHYARAGIGLCLSTAQYKTHKTACNEAKTANVLNREFEQEKTKRFVVSDLTYVLVQNKWHYICIPVDLFNREIIGHSTGESKNAALVFRAFASVRGDLSQIQWFHTERGSEFKNETMSKLLKTFEIGRSLSTKGCPYDNAVAESTFKIMKTEFIRQMRFRNIQHLELELIRLCQLVQQSSDSWNLGVFNPYSVSSQCPYKCCLIFC